VLLLSVAVFLLGVILSALPWRPTCEGLGTRAYTLEREMHRPPRSLLASGPMRHGWVRFMPREGAFLQGYYLFGYHVSGAHIDEVLDRLDPELVRDPERGARRGPRASELLWWWSCKDGAE
jgi:hypothetical protein